MSCTLLEKLDPRRLKHLKIQHQQDADTFARYLAFKREPTQKHCLALIEALLPFVSVWFVRQGRRSNFDADDLISGTVSRLYFILMRRIKSLRFDKSAHLHGYMTQVVRTAMLDARRDLNRAKVEWDLEDIGPHKLRLPTEGSIGALESKIHLAELLEQVEGRVLKDCRLPPRRHGKIRIAVQGWLRGKSPPKNLLSQFERDWTLVRLREELYALRNNYCGYHEDRVPHEFLFELRGIRLR